MNSVISSGGVAAVGERVEDPADGRAGALVLDARLRAEVDALEHERAQREHRAADLVALGDVALARGGLDQVVDERVDALRAGRAERSRSRRAGDRAPRGCRSGSRRRCRG